MMLPFRTQRLTQNSNLRQRHYMNQRIIPFLGCVLFSGANSIDVVMKD